MSSRNQASKFAAHHKKVQDAAAAKDFSGKFTQKQSKFAIRNEEKQLAAAAGGEVTDRRRGRGRDYESTPVAAPTPQPPKPSAMAVAADAGYNPFSPVVRRSASSASKKAADNNNSSNTNNMPVHPGFRVVPQSAAASLNRKSSKFSLSGADGSGHDGHALGDKRERSDSGLGGLMGGRVLREEDAEAAANAADDGPDSKRSKFERFQDLIENTRNERAQGHRDRIEKEQQTAFLDTEFDSIMGLLHRRDKIEEDKLAFKASITPDIQALFDKYRPTGRVAKKLVISSAPVAAPSSAAADDADDTAAAVAGPSTTIEPLKDPKDKKRAGLAPDSQKLLAQINAKAKDGRAPKEIAAMPLAVSAEVKRAMERQEKEQQQQQLAKGHAMPSLLGDESGPIGFGDDDVDGANNGGRKVDEFDLLMGRMRNEATRMAVATDRVLSEEEVEAQRQRMAQLEEDRAAVPQLDLEQKDMARKEWLQRGGDLAHMMGEDDGEEDLDYDHDYDEEIVYSDGDDNASGKDDAEFGDDADGDDAADVDDGARRGGQGSSKGLHAVDEALVAIETKCREHVARLSRKKTIFEQVEESRLFKQQISDLSARLHEACKKSPHYGVESLRMILVSLQKQALAAASAASNKSLEEALNPYHLLLLYIMLNVFPVSDFRHEVVTPLFLFLSATIMQARLRTLNDARIVICLSSLLADGLARGGARFAAEPLVGALNVFALQVPRSSIEPAKLQGTRLPCPMLSRSADALLALKMNHKPVVSTADEAMADAERPLPPLVSLTDALVALSENNAANANAAAAAGKKGVAEFLAPKQKASASNNMTTAAADGDAEEAARLSLITSSIKLLTYLVGHFVNGNAGATASLCDPILRLDAILSEANRGRGVVATYPTNVANLYDSLLERVRAAQKATAAYRTPLAMRTFRPRPIRQFEPLLAEMEDPDVQEHKHLKKVLREDRKRLVRNITAQATVDRKGREREAAADDARRTEKYNKLMGELQQQAHIMKTVDSFMDKGRSKSKKNPSGESKITKKDGDPDEY